MDIYFQHVGERGGQRDFPRTLGDKKVGLRRFVFNDVAEFVSDPSERIRKDLSISAPEGFQIWGVPSGATRILKNLSPGDWFLILESDRPGGQFHYVGQVLHRINGEDFRLSEHLWGEAKFPLIFFLRGQLTSFPWEVFRRNLGYKENWRLSGQTYRLPGDRITLSPYGSAEALLSSMTGVEPTLGADRFDDLLDPAETLISSPEGRRLL